MPSSAGMLGLAWPWGAHPRQLGMVQAEEDYGPPRTSAHTGGLQALSEQAAGADCAGKCMSVLRRAIKRAHFAGKAHVLGICALKISEI